MLQVSSKKKHFLNAFSLHETYIVPCVSQTLTIAIPNYAYNKQAICNLYKTKEPLQIGATHNTNK